MVTIHFTTIIIITIIILNSNPVSFRSRVEKTHNEKKSWVTILLTECKVPIIN